MAITCWAISEATEVQVVGLCHSVQGTTEELASYIGVPSDRVSAWVAGINHMAWFLRFERDGKDAYPQIWEALEDEEVFGRDPVRFEIMRHFGYFVSESTRHMSEYVPYFRGCQDSMERFGLNDISTDLSRINSRNDTYFAEMRDQVNGDFPVVATKSNEYLS